MKILDSISFLLFFIGIAAIDSDSIIPYIIVIIAMIYMFCRVPGWNREIEAEEREKRWRK